MHETDLTAVRTSVTALYPESYDSTRYSGFMLLYYLYVKRYSIWGTWCTVQTLNLNCTATCTEVG